MQSIDAALPLRVLPSRRAWPLLDAAAARAHEARALAGSPPGALMAQAGLAVARLAVARFPAARRVAVFCGPGNNGGDGLVAAVHLQRLGWQVECRHLTGTGSAPADAAAALAAAQATAQAAGLRFVAPTAPLEADLVIDALLGLGASRAPSGAMVVAIATINTSGLPVLAVDLPSGLHPDTGAVLGEAAVRATATLSLLALKPGCFTHQGRDHAGEAWLAELGHGADTATAWLTGPPAAEARAHASHKGRFGDLIVVGGARGMTGAAELAAAAALAAGAGRVYRSLLDGDGDGGAPARPELMGREAAWMLPPDTLAAATVVAGCGGGPCMAEVLPPLLAHAGRLVLDADALNAIATEPALMQALVARSARGRPTALTPHPLEAARLLGKARDAVQADRLAAAQALAERCRAVVLLKGSGSVIAAAGALPFVNPTGNGALATAGTGDVLAGWLGGLWAASPERDPQALAAEAAWQHGAAADRHLAGQAAGSPAGPLRAAELIERLAHPGAERA